MPQPPTLLRLAIPAAAHLTLAIGGNLALAQTVTGVPAAQSPISTLTPVTISADPLGGDVDSLPTPVIVLEGNTLSNAGAATLGATLQNQVGVHDSAFGAGASRPVIRGQDAPRVKVVNDGSELMDAAAISPDHAIDVEPMLARQIEVLRGPATLLYGGGASGGVVNVLDERIPTAIPERGYEGRAEIRGGTASRERTGLIGLTAGAGNLAVRVEGLKRRSGDYRVPGGDTRRLPGSYNDTTTGSLGLSWITPRGYTGIAVTRQLREYGLPGHSHEYESCHPHGTHLHCGGHDDHGHDHDDHEEGHDHGHDHDHDDDHAHPVPFVDLKSTRWDLRSEYRDPLPGFTKLRMRASATRYEHREIEGDEAISTFRNRGHDARLELEHQPLGGWRGVIGASLLRSDFSTHGTEAFMPRTDTRRQALFLLETYAWNDWELQAGIRHDWQRITPEDDQPAYRDRATSASAALTWRFTPGYSVALSAARSQRQPTAQELYANGIHLATNTYEIGNPELRKETSRNLDLTIRKTGGDTRWQASVFHNRVRDYIYARTLDRHEDFRLIEYAQQDADFTGVEGRLTQRLSPIFSASVFGDYVRARFRGDGGDLPRIPGARLGASVHADWQRWSGELEFYRVRSQSRIADYETTTPGYSILNARVAYRTDLGGLDSSIYLRMDNLLDERAYSHASFLGDLAPLPGRSLTLGMRVAF